MFTVIHKNKNYCFDTANELYMFGLGIEANIETKLKTDIETFTAFVKKCHNEDCNNAPLKPFVAFIADWWDCLQDRNTRFIVDKFYEIINS